MIRKRHRRPRVEPGINLIPMLDILLFLIFFFIVATNVKTDSAELEVTLANSRTAAAAKADQATPIVNVDAQGRIAYEGRIVVEEELALELAPLARQGQRRVRLRLDKDVTYQQIIEVSEACKEAGMTQIVSEVIKSPPR